MDSYKDVGFYLFTYNRGIHKQKTYESLPLIIRNMVRFVVYPEEEQEFREAGRNVIVHVGKKGIAYKRQYIIESSPEEYIFMLDDDCTFSRRDLDKKLRPAKRSDVKDMFLLLTDWLKHDNLGQVGMSFRGLNFTQPDLDYKEVQNVYSVFGFNRWLFYHLGLRCDHSVFLTDMQITLGLLSAGYKNRITYKYAVHQTPGTKGGCATYRTDKNQLESIKTVHKLFPKHTRLIERKASDKKSNEGWRKYDLKVAWKKAYLDAFSMRTRKERFKGIL